jgi:hypothetical protein
MTQNECNKGGEWVINQDCDDTATGSGAETTDKKREGVAGMTQHPHTASSIMVTNGK